MKKNNLYKRKIGGTYIGNDDASAVSYATTVPNVNNYSHSQINEKTVEELIQGHDFDVYYNIYQLDDQNQNLKDFWKKNKNINEFLEFIVIK